MRCRIGFFSTIFPGSTWEPGVKRGDENGNADADALLLVLMLVLMLMLMVMVMVIDNYSRCQDIELSFKAPMPAHRQQQ